MAGWADFFPDAAYAGAFGTGTPQEEATRAPTPVDKAVGKAGQIAMIPGQAYNSQTPINTDQMVGPATDLASFVTLGSGAMPAEANSLRMGIKAYHGSPHDFDRFDLSKIGTGEGAQAYGHGLYFAENEGVARNYRDALAGKTQLKTDHGIIDVDQMTNPAQRIAANAIKDSSSPEHARMLVNSFAKVNKEYGPAALQEFEKLQAVNAKPNPGNMYEVDINADPAHFLDWDKPLSEQSKVVEALRPLIGDIATTPSFGTKSGGDALWYAHNQLKGAGIRPEDALRDAGIPGIKYLDQGSRTAGEGSRNYVVFNDSLIDILRKYGWAGIAALPALQSREERT